MSLVESIESTINTTCPNSFVFVFSADNEHFEAVVISESFNNMPLVKQHKTIMTALKDDFSARLHALQLKTFSLNQWETSKDNYPKIIELIKEKYNQ